MSETVDGLKQRLVGAFVILSLAVIFLPMLFDKPHREGSAAVEQVPPKPMRETVVISRPSKPEYVKREIESENAAAEQSKLPQLVPVPPKAEVAEQAKVPVTSTAKDAASSEAVKAETAEVVASAPVKSSARTVDTKVYNNVWMVQLGTFSKKENAYALRDKLRSIGIEGHTKPIKSGTAVRVFAGPYVTKKEALRIKRKLDAEFKVDSLVVFFEA